MPNNASPSAQGRGLNKRPPAETLDSQQHDYNANSVYGTVLTVDALRHAAVVQTNTGGILEGVSTRAFVGPEGEGGFNLPVPGQIVEVDFNMGQPYITGGVPNATPFKDEEPELDAYSRQVNAFLSLTGTKVVYHKGKVSPKNFRSQRPYDLLSGDCGFSAPGGATVYAGRGGVAGIKVNDLLQVVLNAVDDHLRLVSRNFELMTDFGVLRIENDNGKTSLKLSAAKTAEQTWEGEYELELSIGDGKAYVDATLLKDKEQVFTYKLGHSGNQHTFYADDVINQVKGNHGEAVGQNRKLTVGKTDVETIQEEKTIDVPKLHLGQKGGEPAVMGTEITDYLKKLVTFINTEMQVMVPGAGPSLKGTLIGSTPAPEVPDFLSKVVDLVKEHKGE